ncbi:hypothetical protein Dimus_018736 [Dionaea muscipula]
METPLPAAASRRNSTLIAALSVCIPRRMPAAFLLYARLQAASLLLMGRTNGQSHGLLIAAAAGLLSGPQFEAARECCWAARDCCCVVAAWLQCVLHTGASWAAP